MTHPFTNAEEALHYLTEVGQMDDESLNIIECAFAYSLLERPEKDVASYRDYVTKTQNELRQAFDDLSALENGDSVNVLAKALEQVFAKDQGYIGDDTHYDDLQNINLFTVIDRRLGMPISLSILAIGLCRSLHWVADGVNFPGHFIMRLEKDGERLMIDPFQGCKILEAKDLRHILKRIVGESAELSSDFYLPCTNREILLRYQNNMKYRLIDQGDYQDALEVVKRMELIAPKDFRLALDKAVLYARIERPKAAIDELMIYLDQVVDPIDRAEAEAFLFELQKQIN